MPVCVVNQRIKDHHIAERIEIIYAQIPQIFGNLFDVEELGKNKLRKNGRSLQMRGLPTAPPQICPIKRTKERLSHSVYAHQSMLKTVLMRYFYN